MSDITTIPTFRANLILRGKIECLTGLHIGDSKEKLQIGGVDSIVIRSPRTQHPYIPGSSLKGKMRHLLEYLTGGVNKPVHREVPKGVTDEAKLDIHNLGQVSRLPEIARVFGVGVDDREKHTELNGVGLPRLIVRDALPDQMTVDMWGGLGSDANFTEYKAENGIDRLTSAANPRFIERVVEGSHFDFELVFTVYSNEDNNPEEIDIINNDIALVLAGLRLLEGNFLGKSGTRGYGRIRFWLDHPIWIHAIHYKTGSEEWEAYRGELPAKEALKRLSGFNESFRYNPADHAN
jgi:CRISPR-associated protein Csm3